MTKDKLIFAKSLMEIIDDFNNRIKVLHEMKNMQYDFFRFDPKIKLSTINCKKEVEITGFFKIDETFIDNLIDFYTKKKEETEATFNKL